jgi:outer membrane autotransporter protein
LTTAFYSTDGTRTTNTSTSKFNGVDSSANEASLALQYVWLKGKNCSIKPEIKLAYSDSSVDGFSEKNRDVSEALRVQGIDASSLITELAINADWEVVSKLNLKGRIAVNHDFEDASRDVTANLEKETTDFTVRAPGMGQTEVNFTVGATYNFTDRIGFGVSYKGGYNPDANFSNTYSCNLGITF